MEGGEERGIELGFSTSCIVSPLRGVRTVMSVIVEL